MLYKTIKFKLFFILLIFLVLTARISHSSQLLSVRNDIVNEQYIIQLEFSEKVEFSYKEKTRGIHFELSINNVQVSGSNLNYLRQIPQTYLKNVSVQYVGNNLYINFILESGTFTKLETTLNDRVLKVFFRNVINKDEVFLSESKIRELKNNNVKIVVIDPGHGGSDPGAVTDNNIREKDLALDYSIVLYEMLKKNDNIHPILTRNSDYYLSLWDRNRIAQENQADVFLSIHFNYHFDRRARGTNVYYYLDTAELDTETKFIANLENRVFFEHEKQFAIFFEEESDLNLLFWELRKAHTIQESARLTSYLINSLKKNDDIIVRDSMSFANFVVLKNLIVPSVLIEVGFLSNLDDLKLILSNEYKISYCKAIYYALLDYLKR